MKKVLIIAGTVLVFTWLACKPKVPKLLTASIKVGTSELIVQKLPDNYADNTNDTAGNIGYYRIIVHSPYKLDDTASVNYVNFGIEQSLFLVRGTDTIAPGFCQRIANGKEHDFEYIAAFDLFKDTAVDKQAIYLQDKVFGLGDVQVNF